MLVDLDDTLVDHRGAAAAGVRRWLLSEGWATEEQVPALVAVWNEVAERHFPAYRARRTTFLEHRRLRLREFLPTLDAVGPDAALWSDERLDAVFASYDAAYTAAWRAFDDALPCLEALAGAVEIGVLTNGDQAQQEAKVIRTGLAGHVAAVLSSDALGVAKPDPSAFTTACARLGVAPGAAAYVGDRLDVDALAATAAGLHGIWLDRTGAGTAGAPDGIIRITTLADLGNAISTP